MFNTDNTTYTTEQFTLMLGDCLERMKEIESGSIDCVNLKPFFLTITDDELKFR